CVRVRMCDRHLPGRCAAIVCPSRSRATLSGRLLEIGRERLQHFSKRQERRGTLLTVFVDVFEFASLSSIAVGASGSGKKRKSVISAFRTGCLPILTGTHTRPPSRRGSMCPRSDSRR